MFPRALLWLSTGLDAFSYLQYVNIIPRLHDQAGSTSWLYVGWTSQLDVSLMLAKCLLDVCSMSVRCFLDRVNGVLLVKWERWRPEARH